MTTHKANNDGLDEPASPCKRRKLDTIPPQDIEAEFRSQPSQLTSPNGLLWDNLDYSCGYDSMFTVLYNIWNEDRVQWSQRMATFSPVSELLCSCLEMFQAGVFSFKQARELVRRHMHDARPKDFPYGQVGTSIDHIASIFASQLTYATGNKVCRMCGYIDPEDHQLLSSFLCAIASRELSSRYPTGVPIDAWLKDHMNETRTRCPVCLLSGQRTRMDMVTRGIQVPSFLFISMEGGHFTYTSNLVLDCNGQMSVLGIIYGGQAHFTCRFIDSAGQLWYHDGMITGRECMNDGMLTEIDTGALECTREKLADICRVIN
jgi:hypothetical protein